jgi:hypothetical protein
LQNAKKEANFKLRLFWRGKFDSHNLPPLLHKGSEPIETSSSPIIQGHVTHKPHERQKTKTKKKTPKTTKLHLSSRKGMMGGGK